MSISTTDLTAERQVLEKDFEALSNRIKQVDQELIQMKSNLNAVHGAIQQIDKLITMSEKSGKELPKDKEKPLNIATTQMKKFKSFVKEENLKDFEEDVLAETPPNTADAMKRHKAGKAGFTDIAHLKAKGLIPRSDGNKKVSDKYK